MAKGPSAGRLFATLALFAFLLPANALSQTGFGVLTGTVEDATKALIPGVTITATNVGTGVVTQVITNESGTFNIPQLLPGRYKLTAELPGFRGSAFENIELGGNETKRFNFTLEVSSVAQSVEVSIDAATLLSTSSASITQVLPESKIKELPIVGNNVLDLLNTMAGVRLDPTNGASGTGTTFAGVSSLQINTVRDGLSVSDGRFNNGVFATTRLSPDLVSEVRVVLTPVDAEMGRGNGQVQIITRSGTNKFSGAGVWDIRNTALNSNTWANNRVVDGTTGKWSPTPLDYENNNEYQLSAGGPIQKNKTFFYALWDQNINVRRTLITGTVLTDTARQGIFRYFDAWSSGNANANTVTTGTNPSIAVVDFLGNPRTPATNPTGAAYTGGLKCFSVFGNVKANGTPFTALDCPGGTAITNTTWDPLRTGMDTTGYIKKVLDIMPHANWFGSIGVGGGDGLNVAGYRWTLHRHGAPGGATVTQGQNTDIDSKQFNLKIDHNINAKHKLSSNWSTETGKTDSDVPNWPGGLGYTTARTPQVFTTNFTSTLSPNLLNEARFGIRYTKANIDAPFEQDRYKQPAQEWMLPGSNGYTGIVSPGVNVTGGQNFSFGGSANGIFNTNPGQYNGNTSKLYNYGDTVSWTRGKHSLKFGGEIRFTSTNGYNNVAGGGVVFPFPTIQGGAGNNVSLLGTAGNTPLLPASSLVGTPRANSVGLLYFLAGSVNQAQMLYWIDSQNDVTSGKWQDVTTAPNGRKYRNSIQNEYSGFAKDDWKVTKDLTLNLGLRWDFYGSPYIGSGLTSTVAGLGDGLWGTFLTGGDNVWERWLTPGNIFLSGYGPNGTLTCALPSCDPSKAVNLEFIGPKTQNPSKIAVPNDWNNFGPAVGFAWQVPGFAPGSTTLRGGYQITFGGAGKLIGGGFANTLEFIIGNPPGNNSIGATGNYISELNGQYLDLRNAAQLVPAKPTNPALPGGSLSIYQRSNVSVYDSNYVTPYTQNFTLALTRNVSKNVIVDLRYIGTVSKKQDGQISLNTSTIYHNKELLDALSAARRGEDPVLLDQMLAGLNINSGQTGYGPVGTLVNGVLQTGGAQLRRNSTTASQLANGDFVGVAAFLAGNGTGLPAGTGAGTLVGLGPNLTGVTGRILRNGCDRLATGQTTVGPNEPVSLRCFPENYIYAIPQLGATAGAALETNSAFSNYHSMQAQVTLRPTQGFSYQATYTWSKTLGIPNGTSAFTDPSDRRADYTLLSSHRKHDIRLNGTFSLPIGPDKLLLRRSSGWVARAVEGWQTSLIFSANSGAPAPITALSGLTNLGLYGNGVPDVVGDFKVVDGKVRWDGPNNALGTSHGGTYFGSNTFMYVPDPQCAQTNVADKNGFNAFANGNCTLQAVALRNADGTAGPIVLQNPKPGTRGNLGQNVLEQAGVWNFDANLSKSFKIDESKSVQFRVDAINVLNHPGLNNPNLNINSATSTFGEITTKTNANRTFQARLRLTF